MQVFFTPGENSFHPRDNFFLPRESFFTTPGKFLYHPEKEFYSVQLSAVSVYNKSGISRFRFAFLSTHYILLPFPPKIPG